MEIVAGTEGNLTVAEPLTSVRTANSSQCHPIGDTYKTYAECAIAHTPIPAMAHTYTRAHRDSPLLVISQIVVTVLHLGRTNKSLCAPSDDRHFILQVFRLCFWTRSIRLGGTPPHQYVSTHVRTTPN